MVKNVTIIQERLTHYRVPLFQILRESLDRHKVHLKLIHGCAKGAEAKKNDVGYIEWAIQVNNLKVKLGGTEALWQPALKHLSDSNLVIVTQENRMILNYFLLARKSLTHQKIAFWGHGKNFQRKTPMGLKELWKRFYLNKPDWWFAYTSLTQKILLSAKYPVSKITVLNNAIDTNEMEKFAKSITEDKIYRLRMDLGIVGKHVGIFCGSLYIGKRIDVVIAAARQVRTEIYDFELVVIGAGPDEYLVKEAAKSSPWIHYVGPRFDYEKVLFMKLGQFFLLPYGVGLAILDSFALGLPIVTMIDGNHGPEIAYLRPGVNGIIAGNSIEDYANAICTLLSDRDKYSKIVEQCLVDASIYTIENMAKNFSEGILECLD